MTKTRHAESRQPSLDRRRFLATGAASRRGSGCAWQCPTCPSQRSRTGPDCHAAARQTHLAVVQVDDDPGHCGDEPLAARLRRAAEAGFDGVDLDEAGKFTPEQARAAVEESGVFVHNAINHAHWEKTLTSPDEAVRAAGRANIEHCLRVSHAAGGSGVLIVVGHGQGWSGRCRGRTLPRRDQEVDSVSRVIGPDDPDRKRLEPHVLQSRRATGTERRSVRGVHRQHQQPLGRHVLRHWQPLEVRPTGRVDPPVRTAMRQDGCERVQSRRQQVDGNHRGRSAVGPGAQALDDIGFAGWATAEVGGGDVKRLTHSARANAAGVWRVRREAPGLKSKIQARLDLFTTEDTESTEKSNLTCGTATSLGASSYRRRMSQLIWSSLCPLCSLRW